jgi:hypothetical protein
MTATKPQPVARSDGPREHSDVGDLLTARTAFDLENGPGCQPVRITLGCRQQLADGQHQWLQAGTRDRGAKEDGVYQRPPRLSRKSLAKSVVRDTRLVLDVGRQDPSVPLGQHLGQRSPELGIVRARGREVSAACAERAQGSHRDDRRRQPLGDRAHNALIARSGTVDLVDEHQCRNPQPLQRSHQDAGLWLDTLDGRDHEDRTVQHAQDPFHLRDEVRMARRVDQVDVDVLECERRDGRLDRDAALPLEFHRIRLRGAGVDAADLVDDTGPIQQPFGESCLTGVYMRQDPKVQLFLRHASYPPNRSQRPCRWK